MRCLTSRNPARSTAEYDRDDNMLAEQNSGAARRETSRHGFGRCSSPADGPDSRAAAGPHDDHRWIGILPSRKIRKSAANTLRRAAAFCSPGGRDQSKRQPRRPRIFSQFADGADDLPDRIREAIGAGAEQKVYLEVDSCTRFSDVAAVLDQIRAAKISQIRFLTEKLSAQ